MEKLLKILFNGSRIILGIVFIFSGFVKGIDLTGYTYKINEYFGAAGLPEMPQIALIISFLMSGAEFLIGIALVTGIFINLTAWTTVFFMGYFTLLTFILAVFNPVSDCGCFGDAIKLTNWETFLKNLVFSVLVVFIFTRRKKFVFHSPLLMEWSVLITTIIIYSVISVYSYRHLPVIDFLPYSIGSNISEKMKTPADAPKDEYETIFLYKNIKTGKVKEFNMNNYPWQDTVNWKWVKTESKLTKKGYVPPIHDFSISTPQGNSITDIILSDTLYTFLFVSPDLNKADPKGFEAAKNIFSYCLSENNCRFYAVTSSTAQDIEKIRTKHSIPFDFYSADQTALKTMIRSNPGLILLKHGNIIGKWHYNDMQEALSNSTGNFLADNVTKLRKAKENALSLSVMLGTGLILSLFWAFSLYFEKGKRKR